MKKLLLVEWAAFRSVSLLYRLLCGQFLLLALFFIAAAVYGITHYPI